MRRMHGFTLIEIMVSLMIFGIIMLTVFSAFRSFMLSDHIVKTSLGQSDTLRAFTCRVAADLKLIRILLAPEYKKPEFDSRPDRFRFHGDESVLAGHVFSRLRFVSLAHIAFGNDPRTGAAQIVYYVRQNRDKTFDLCRSDTTGAFADLDSLSCDPVLLSNITRFSLTFIDAKGDEYKSWDSESDSFDYATPLSVNFYVEYMYQEKSAALKTSFYLPVTRRGAE